MREVLAFILITVLLSKLTGGKPLMLVCKISDNPRRSGVLQSIMALSRNPHMSELTSIEMA